MRYTKKPVTVEAVQFMGLTDFGDPQFDVADGMPDWLMEALAGPEHSTGSIWTAPGQAFIGEGEPPKEMFIGTVDGQYIASPGDWIIRGPTGEIYPCDKAAFEADYDTADDHPGPAWKEGDSLSIEPEIVQVAKEARRSLLLDMQSECIQLRVALVKARDYLMYENPEMAAMCQKAIDCRPVTGSVEPLAAALAETDVAHPSDLPNGSVERLRGASRLFVIGAGYQYPIGEDDQD